MKVTFAVVTTNKTKGYHIEKTMQTRSSRSKVYRCNTFSWVSEASESLEFETVDLAKKQIEFFESLLKPTVVTQVWP